MDAIEALACVVVLGSLAAMYLVDRRARASTPRQQVLLLEDTQLIAYSLDGGELVLDLFGGGGRWASYAGGAVVASGHVVDTPAFTIRAATGGVVDLGLFEKLASWVESSDPLQIRLEATGTAPLEQPTRLELSDGRRSLSVRESHPV